MDKKPLSIFAVLLILISIFNISIFSAIVVEPEQLTEPSKANEETVSLNPISPTGPSSTSTATNTPVSLLESNSHGGSWLDSFEDSSGIDLNYSDNLNTTEGNVKILKSPPQLFNVDQFTAALWHCDGGSGTILNDASTNNNDGTLQLSTSWTTGRFGNGLDFNGGGLWFNGDCVSVPHSSSLDLTGSFTIEAWIKTGTTYTYGVIVDKHDRNIPAVQSYGYTLLIAGGKLRFAIYSGANGCCDNLYGTQDLRDNNWHYVAGVFNGTHMQVYVDCQLEGVKAWNFGPGSNTINLGIGKRILGWGGYMPFDGIIDEVRISNVARDFTKFANLTSTPINLTPGMNWDTIIINKTEPQYTTLAVTILNASDNQPIPGSQIFTGDGEFNISYLDPVKYPSIKLQASFVTESCQKNPVLHYWGVSWNATNAWRDSFFKGPKVGSSENMFAYEGEIQLSTNPVQQQSSPSYYNIGNLNSTPVTLPLNYSWDTLIVNKTEPVNTSLTITIYDYSINIAIMGYTNLIQSLIDLSGLDPTTYPVIKLVAKFNSTNGANTPVLYDWSVNWTYANEKPVADAGPNLTIFENQVVMLNGTGSSDPDGSIVNWSWDIDTDGVYDLFGPYANYTYNDDSLNNVSLMVTDDQGANDTDYVMITVLNLNSTIDDFNITILQAYPRTIGYWKHQCKIASPKGDHTGIKPEYITGINSNSSVFTTLSTKEDILRILEPADSSNMTAKAEQQLMGLWLNVVSGKLGTSVVLNLMSLTAATTVGAALVEIEQIILNSSSNRSELERAKDIADSINNGIGLITTTILDIHASDPGSDDITLTIDWNDGSANTTIIFFNNDPINTTDPYPSQFSGLAPFNIHTTLTHKYNSSGNYLITIMVHDDDGGQTIIKVNINI